MKWLLSPLLGIFLGAGIYTFYYARGTSYLSNDPQACVNCHIMRSQYDSWEKASHHAYATCNDCHTPHSFLRKWIAKADNGYHHSVAFTLMNFHEPIQTKPTSVEVLNSNCLYCHKEYVSEITAHRVPQDQGLDCVRCHDNAGHGPRR
jgi:cytochrome c nitrite reductase small subunit